MGGSKKGKPAAKAYRAGGKDNTLWVALVGVLVVGVASFWMLNAGPSGQTSEYENFIAGRGIKRSRLDVACNGTGVHRWCRLIAKRNIQQGEKVVTMPLEQIVQPEAIVRGQGHPLQKALAVQSQEDPLAQFMQQARIGAFYNQYILTFYIWHEMKLGARSELNPWIEFISKSTELNHVAYWDEEDVACLDMVAGRMRNETLELAAIFAQAAQVTCTHNPDLESCQSFDPEKTSEEFKWAYVTMKQRTWGDGMHPVLIPVVDNALSHAPLCAPEEEGGDGDLACQGRQKAQGLAPQQTEDNRLAMIAQVPFAKDEYVYASHHPANYWETLATFGVVGYSSNIITDHFFVHRFSNWAAANGLQQDRFEEGHPLRFCGTQYVTAFQTNGNPKKELRNCWSALYYFLFHPEARDWSPEAAKAFKKWQKNKVEKAKNNYMVQRALHRSAQNTLSMLLQAPQCASTSKNAQSARKTLELGMAAIRRAEEIASKAASEKFDIWLSLDAGADRDISDDPPPPSATAEEPDDGDEDIGDLDKEDEAQKEEI